MPTFAELGYWKVGGPCQRFEVVEDAARLRALIRGEGSVFVIGNGSNLLVSDDGLAGTTVRLAGALRAVDVVDEAGDSVELRVGAGLLNAVLLNRYLGKLAGLAPLVGVPGTMGGAVAMNAGTALGEIGDVVLRVEGTDASGDAVTVQRADLPMAYREGGLPDGFIVTTAVLGLSRVGAADEVVRAQAHLERRKATQPLALPSCGSVFRNPPPDAAGKPRAAGQLIDSVGLKGWRCGGAQISEKHANFIVNCGGASATDVMTCIHKAWSTVRDATGVRLTPEVRVVGDWDKKLWPLGGDPG